MIGKAVNKPYAKDYKSQCSKLKKNKKKAKRQGGKIMSQYDLGWGEIKEPGTGGNVDFMKLQNGINQLRIVGKPSLVDIHWEKGVDGSNKKIICPGAGCPICKAGHVPMNRYQVQVVDRADSKVKVLEGGPTIFNSIKAYAMDPDYGDPTTYDLKIKKEGSGRETKYTVVAAPKKSHITDEEQKAVESTKTLSEINKPKTIEEIMQLGLEILTGSISDLDDGFGSTDNPSTAMIDDDDWNAL